jgi:hypothetical protein
MQDALKMTDEDDRQKSGTRLGRYLSQKSLQPFVYREKKPGHYDPIVMMEKRKLMVLRRLG